MALSIDSRAILRAIIDNPGAFPAVTADLDDFARKTLIKQLKWKSIDAELFKKIYHSVGETNVSTLLDSYAANDLATLVKKIDPFSSFAKIGEASAQVRTHISEIATGRKLPSAKPDKTVKTPARRAEKKEAPPKIGSILESKVHSGKPRASRAKK